MSAPPAPLPGPYLGPETGQFDMVLAGHSAAAGLEELARIEEVQRTGRAEAVTLTLPVYEEPEAGRRVAAVETVTGIAVVIPARDEGAAIGGTLESLAGQALRPDRIVVVVNNSTDATEAVAREFAARPGAPATDVLVMPGRNKFRKAGALNYGIRHLIGWRHLRDGQPLPAETWLTMHHPGDAAEIAEAKADAIAHRIHARADRVEARSMWAVDRAGTVYASMLRRGIDDTPVTQVEYAGPGRTIKGGIPAALERIVSATLAVTMPGGR